MNPLRISEMVKSKWYHRFYQVLVWPATALAVIVAIVVCLQNHTDEDIFFILFISSPAILIWVGYRAILFIVFGRGAFAK